MDPDQRAALDQLQQSTNNLGPPLILDGKSYNSTYDFKTFGFMVVKGLVDKSLLHARTLNSMKQKVIKSPKIRYINNNKGSGDNDEGIGQRLQIITKKIDGEDFNATRIFTRAQKNILSACREPVMKHARSLLGINGSIDLVETVLLSLDNSTVIQTPHPDLDSYYDSKAVLAIVSLEDHTTFIIYARTHNWKENDQRRIGCRYGLLAGDALFFHPSCIHAGDSYVKSNIRLHYYAFEAGTKWEEDSAYDLPTDYARKITHNPEVTVKTLKRTLSARESRKRTSEAKRLMTERGAENLMREKGLQKAASDILREFYEFTDAKCVEIATECLEAIDNKLVSGQPHSL
jgi:hypothetical protein